MEYEWIKLPLYPEWDYKYNVSIAGQSVDLRIYYSDRTQKCSFDASYANGDIILEGSLLVPYTPTLEYKIEGVSGFLWLEPISQDINEATLNPDHIYKYFNLYYIYWTE